jgi:hypothetical protein
MPLGPARSDQILDDAHTRLGSLDEELVVRRPLLVPPTGKPPGAVERSTSLAVASALATLAQALWGTGEQTHPLLALQRLADLDGTLTFEDSRIVIRPAIGRRYMDLARHGMLVDVATVPWWPGRRMEFAGL